MMVAPEAFVTVSTILRMNNAAVLNSYNRAIEWNACGDADDALRDRLALLRPCIVDIAVPMHGLDNTGAIHHRIRVRLPVGHNDFVTCYLDVRDSDYRSAIVSDVPRLLELELPAFTDDPMHAGITRAKARMFDECFRLFDEYDALSADGD